MQSPQKKICGSRLYRRFGSAALIVIGALISTTPAYAWDSPVAIDLNTSTGVRADCQFSLSGEGELCGVVWSSTSAPWGDFGIRFSRSTDAGATWSPPEDLSGLNGAGNGEFGDNTVLAVQGSTWLAAWDACETSGRMIENSRDIYLRRSTDAGLNWSAPQFLNSDFTDLGVRNFSPILQSGGFGTWIALWQSEILDPADSYVKRAISVSRSIDAGLNWSAVQRLEVPTSSPLIMNPRLTTNGQGVWLAAWETSGPDSDIRLVRSADDGQTWSSPVELDADGNQEESVISYDGQPSIATDGQGRWVILWTSNYDSATDSAGHDRILCVRSSDDGATWSASSQAHSSDGYPRQTPHVIWDSGQLIAVWSSPGELEAAVSTDNGLSWTTAAAPGEQSDSSGGIGSRPRLISLQPSGRLAAWFHYAPGATGPDLVSSRETGNASANNWFLY